MNKKISTEIGVFIIVIIAVVVGVLVWKYEKNQNDSQISSVASVLKPTLNNSQKENKIEISDKWTLISHNNFWDDSTVFKQGKYSFPNIKFSYPENWEFRCCGDMDNASEHFINLPNGDKSSPHIRIVNFNLKGCANQQKICSLDKMVKITADEKYDQLIENVPKDQILPEKKLEKLNTNAFVYKKVEKNGNFSQGYLINLGNDVVEVDFVNYESSNDDFINDFLSHIFFDNITEQVSFCGKTYTTKRIVLNDVDVIKRIATIAQNNKFGICENIDYNYYNSLEKDLSARKDLPVKFNKQKPTDIDYKDGVYFLNIGLVFKINSNTNNIYIIGAYAGEPIFIGKLK